MAAAFWFLSKKYPDFLSRLFGFREEQASLGARLRRLIGNGLLLALLLTVHFSLPDYEMPWLRWGLHVPLALGAAMVLLFRTVGALLDLCFDEKPDLRKPVPVSVDRLSGKMRSRWWGCWTKSPFAWLPSAMRTEADAFLTRNIAWATGIGEI